ncbi:hypothetical protein NL676_034475 [Syzygium grande]|nr:hypothetical protein NL676_034475 [Syzygium grande]
MIFVDPSGRLGNFTTIQSAIDSVPSNNRNWVCIYIKKGIYRSPRGWSDRIHHSARKEQPRRCKRVRVQGVKCVRLRLGLVGKDMESLHESHLL